MPAGPSSPSGAHERAQPRRSVAATADAGRAARRTDDQARAGPFGGRLEETRTMARQSGDATPVMDRDTTATTGKTRNKSAAATAARFLSGPYGASFDGTDGHGHQVK